MIISHWVSLCDRKHLYLVTKTAIETRPYVCQLKNKWNSLLKYNEKQKIRLYPIGNECLPFTGVDNEKDMKGEGTRISNVIE